MRTQPSSPHPGSPDPKLDIHGLPPIPLRRALHGAEHFVLMRSVERCIRRDTGREVLPPMDPLAILEWLRGEAAMMYEPALRQRGA
jgi:hypothetical protein